MGAIMIAGRKLPRMWDVFQTGHYGWFYADGCGVARGPYRTERKAKNARDQARGQLFSPSQSDPKASAKRLTVADAMTIHLREVGPAEHMLRSDPSRPTTSAIRRPGGSATARPQSSKSRAESDK